MGKLGRGKFRLRFRLAMVGRRDGLVVVDNVGTVGTVDTVGTVSVIAIFAPLVTGTTLTTGVSTILPLCMYLPQLNKLL